MSYIKGLCLKVFALLNFIISRWLNVTTIKGWNSLQVQYNFWFQPKVTFFNVFQIFSSTGIILHSSNQCKEIEENNRMGETRDLFIKIRDTKGTFHAKMGSIKDRNGMDLTEAEDIQKRWQEYTEELYKKNVFMTQIITMVWSVT